MSKRRKEQEGKHTDEVVDKEGWRSWSSNGNTCKTTLKNSLRRKRIGGLWGRAQSWTSEGDRTVNKCCIITWKWSHYSLSGNIVPSRSHWPWLRLGLLGCRNLNANSGNMSLYLHWMKRQVHTKTHHVDLPSAPPPSERQAFIFGRNSLYPWIVYLKIKSDVFPFFFFL